MLNTLQCFDNSTSSVVTRIDAMATKKNGNMIELFDLFFSQADKAV